MECFALFKTAEFLGKKAACLLTVVDANYTKENLTSKQREEDLDDMIEIALESVVSIDKIKDELDEIEEHFGKDIAFLVDGVTKVGKARAGMGNLETYLPQTKDNLSKLLIAVGQDVRVVIIKLADRLHNVQTLQYMSPEKQKKM